MSEPGEDIELQNDKTSNKNVDIDELDYEEFDEGNKNKGGDSDGEIKSDDDVKKTKSKKADAEEGEESDESDNEESRKKRDDTNKTEEIKQLSEEEGEINDGEKVRKAFVPRVPCKFYQRGKCSWGRNCKFLHPGVNDTGNYTFLEVGDPNARVYQQSQMSSMDTGSDSIRDLDQTESSVAVQQNETAWEKALRNAREMKEKAKQRKMQEQKEEFKDKQMNLSLKEFENEKENDERYMNIENAVIADDDLRDDDVEQYRGRMEEIRKTSSAQQQQLRNRLSYDASGPSRSRGRESDRRGSPSRRDRGGAADTWHDPWDRSRTTANKPKKGARGGRDDRSSYSFSSSGSSSRSSSSTRSSYSSSSYSSRSNSRSSYSSRSPSPGSKQRKAGAKKTSTKTKSSHSSNPAATKSSKSGKQTEVAVKKTGPTPIPPAAVATAGKKNRSRSNSTSSYSSHSSKSGAGNDSMSESDNSSVESYSDEEKAKKRTKSAKSGGAVKRSAPEGKDKSELKKSKVTSSPPPNASGGSAIKDKKQQIKDHLKQLENALKRKNMAK